MVKKPDQNIIKKICMNERNSSWICLGFAYSFMICVFAPLEAYFANQEEFWFTLLQVLPVVLIVFVVSVFALLFIFLCIKGTKLAVWFYAFIFCTMLYLYIQGNYVPRKYGVLNGMDIQWENYQAYAIVSLMLIFIFSILWIVISLKVKEKIYGVGKWICTGLVVVQLITLATLVLQNGGGEKSTTVVTTKDMFKLSENRNIIVFILDQFDSADMQELLNEDNKYRDLLENFTYYPDAMGGYPSTLGSVPYILTGEKYELGTTYRDWVNNGYENSNIYTTMKEKKYAVGLYTYPQFVNPDYAVNVERADYVINSYSNFAKTMYKLVAFNYMPHQLKRLFYTESEEFLKLRASKKYDVYSADTPNFYEMLKHEGLTFSDEDNKFIVYHVDGTHPPYTFDEMLTSGEDRVYDVYDEAEGCLHLLDEYMQTLKENNAYDNTAIIVMADHGYHGLWQNPIFMIKNFAEKHEFTISDVKMSWDYLDEIFISLASGEKVDDMYITKCANHSDVRKFSYYTWDNDKWDRRYMPEITDYIAYGDAKDISKFECVDEFPYYLGDVLSFGKPENAQKYCVYGIGSSEGSAAWTIDRYALMQFDLKDDYENILVDMEYSAVTLPPQTVIVYANQQKVAEFVAEDAGSQEFVIPHQLVDEGRLVLGFEFPNSISPKDRGTSEDIRKLALYMKTIVISSTDKEEEKKELAYECDYVLGSELTFSREKATANSYCISGFANNEDGFTWTCGNEAEMDFRLSDEYNDLLLNISYFTHTDAQHVMIYVNDNKIEDYIAEGAETKQIVIPKESIEDGRIVLRFGLPDAISPKENGTGEDVRKLALAMTSLTISSMEQ